MTEMKKDSVIKTIEYGIFTTSSKDVSSGVVPNLLATSRSTLGGDYFYVIDKNTVVHIDMR